MYATMHASNINVIGTTNYQKLFLQTFMNLVLHTIDDDDDEYIV